MLKDAHAALVYLQQTTQWTFQVVIKELRSTQSQCVVLQEELERTERYVGILVKHRNSLLEQEKSDEEHRNYLQTQNESLKTQLQAAHEDISGFINEQVEYQRQLKKLSDKKASYKQKRRSNRLQGETE
ncbi:hypothetical protein BU23DRAFT_572972 [Bimuria novae-zelandiae CBS 107.79]|uniref:Uncharacterized protein n=1 Tax=Bimuria novae-zelandiae CBS 107.79 TaxID=1447943 RepID=A0A6A5V2Y0_9PLEO|nr:hypothetical protein BU23DRAFT_572972 [Bimuria novae-zelandiae CBS 107.79]